MLTSLIFIFLVGLLIGSFLNVLVDRIVVGESVVFGKSHCDKCKKNIEWYDLIPILSFILLKRKCRFCSAPLSFYYPIIELVTGVLFAFTFFFFNSSNFLATVYYLTIMSILIVVFFEDLKHGTISDKIIYPSIALVLVYQAVYMKDLLLYNFLSAISSFIFFLALFLITRGKGMGFGDVKFSFLMGLFLGFPKIIVGLYLAFLTGAIVGVILILCRKKKLKGSTVPFGPFLVVGSILSLFYSDFFLKLLMLKLF